MSAALDAMIRDASEAHLRDHTATPLFTDCANPLCRFAVAAMAYRADTRTALEAAQVEAGRLRVLEEGARNDYQKIADFMQSLPTETRQQYFLAGHDMVPGLIALATALAAAERERDALLNKLPALIVVQDDFDAGWNAAAKMARKAVAAQQPATQDGGTCAICGEPEQAHHVEDGGHEFRC